MSFKVIPIAEEHIESFRAAVDRVAREHRYLALLEAPPLEAVREFVRENIRNGNPQLVALVDGAVVGWCDIIPKAWESLRHSGVLGMGVIPEYRGQGIGGALIAATLEAAKRKGLTRIELTVRTDNEPARKLYEKLGFVHEGRFLRHLKIGGEYRDSDQMALLF
jgi:RimJ/RimL family protein N-acetyltransferase